MAKEFSRQHKNVLQSIDSITTPESGVSEEFTRLNFQPSYFRDQSGKKNREYLMTRDGFTILAMGFTGKKAMRFKEAYIQRFNQMETFIKSLQATKIEFPVFTAAVMDAHEEPKRYHFSNEINMIYRIVLGMDAKKYREQNVEKEARKYAGFNRKRTQENNL